MSPKLSNQMASGILFLNLVYVDLFLPLGLSHFLLGCFSSLSNCSFNISVGSISVVLSTSLFSLLPFSIKASWNSCIHFLHTHPASYSFKYTYPIFSVGIYSCLVYLNDRRIFLKNQPSNEIYYHHYQQSKQLSQYIKTKQERFPLSIKLIKGRTQKKIIPNRHILEKPVTIFVYFIIPY